MKKLIKIVILVAFAAVSLSSFGKAQAMDAGNGCTVSAASVYWAPGWTTLDANGNVISNKFSVSLTLGGSCSGYSVDGYFYCNDGGANLDEWGGNSSTNTSGGGSLSDISSISIGSASESGGYYYRTVNIVPKNSGYQPLKGTIKKRAEVTLYRSDVDTSGKVIMTAGGKIKDTVSSGSTATITSGSLTGWDFLGWKLTATASSYQSNSTSYSETISSDTTRYAVYQKKKFTFKAYAVDKYNNHMDPYIICSTPKTVEYGDSISCTAPSYTGYTFKGWSTTPPSSWGSYTTFQTASKYSNTSVSDHVTIYAIYELNTYTLKATADAHATITVTRTKSPYPGAASWTSLTAHNGTETETIYYGDQLTVSYSYDGCLSTGYDYIKNSESVSGQLSPVKENVTISSTSKDQSKILTVHYRDTLASSIKTDDTVRVCYNKDATKLRPSISGYDFVGWRTTSWSGGSTSYCNSSCDDSSKHSLTGHALLGVTNSTYSFDYYTRKKLTTNQEIYAVYAKKYTLSLIADPFTKNYAKRTKSPYALASTSSSWTADSISSSSVDTDSGTVYYGDDIYMTYDKDSCLDWGYHTFNSSSISSGDTRTVTGDSTLKTHANLREYTLTKSQATGTTITVDRKSSPYGKKGVTTTKNNTLSSNASTGSLSSGVAVYCGDTLSATFSISNGYSWGNYDWANNAHQWGFHYQSDNSGQRGNKWDETGPKSGSSNDSTDHSSHTLPSSGTYTVDDNVLAETQSVQDKFEGRARVDSGSTVGSDADMKQYTSTTSTANKTIECANEGCGAAFDLYARTTQGTGPMYYKLGTSKNWVSSGNISWVPLWGTSSVKPKTTGTWIDGQSTTLHPGQSMCRYLRFTPVGTSSDMVDAGACMHTIESLFQGRIQLTGNIAGNNGNDDGWTNTNKSEQVFYAKGCTDGCTVTFNHQMKRTQGIGSTDFTTERISNLTTTTRGIVNGTAGSGTFRPSTDTSQNNAIKTVTTDGVYTLYPGMKVCETLTFKPSNNVVYPKDAISLTVCALALGNSQPDDPGDPNDPDHPENDPNENTGSRAFIDIEVKNDSVSRYNSYRRWVYAKPGDDLTFRAYYNPTLQYTYWLKPQKMQIDGGTTYPTIGNNSSKNLGTLFNDNRGNRETWKNYFSVQKRFERSSNSSWKWYTDYTNYTIGSMTGGSPINPVRVSESHVGQSIDEQAITNLNKNTQTTPSQVTFTCTQEKGSNECTGSNKGNVITNPKSNIAYARIPYNFNIDATITTPETTPVYAGENMPINYDIDVNEKTNCETASCGSYTTHADEVRRKIVVYNPDTVGLQGGGVKAGGRDADICSDIFGYRNGSDEKNCGYAGDKTEDLDIGKNGRSDTPFYAQDWEAGKKVCVAVAVFPANSGADTNWYDMNYSNSWRISESKCYSIAKRPSLQIWGGNFYTAGSVYTSISKKNNVSGYTTSYTVQNGDTDNYNYVFGSWGELGVISAGLVQGFASGAGTGFALNSSNTLWPSYNSNNTGNTLLGTSPNPHGPGGSREKSGSTTLCHRNRLTFANYPCTGNAGSLNNGATIRDNAKRDKSSIISTFTSNIPASQTYTVSGDLTITASTGAGYYSSDGSFNINGAAVSGGTYAIESKSGNITIAGDLKYIGEYATYYNIPKIVIHANNINIKCGVSRVDAVLIADDTVTTCSDSDDINSRANSNPLRINGTVIANKLVPNRTYGAAAGANSIIPAEIINYDSTLYLWGSHQSDTSGSGKLNVTYTRELAPRY